jgi:hypothetical protein
VPVWGYNGKLEAGHGSQPKSERVGSAHIYKG